MNTTPRPRSLFLQIAQALLTFFIAVLAISGEALRSGEEPWFRRLSVNGRLIVACLLFAFVAQFGKDLQERKEGRQAFARERTAEKAQLKAESDRDNLNRQLEETRTRLEATYALIAELRQQSSDAAAAQLEAALATPLWLDRKHRQFPVRIRKDSSPVTLKFIGYECDVWVALETVHLLTGELSGGKSIGTDGLEVLLNEPKEYKLEWNAKELALIRGEQGLPSGAKVMDVWVTAYSWAPCMGRLFIDGAGVSFRDTVVTH